MMEVTEFIDRISPLDDAAKAGLLKAFERKTFKKGEHIVRAEEVSKHYYFIEKGLVKSHFLSEDKEFIMTFFKENMMFSEISSYLTQKSSRYMIMALEDCVVHGIQKNDIDKLCQKHHCIETLFRILFSKASIGMMKRISEMLEENATERYKIFVQENNGLLQRISLGDLASYLGITQVSLSRIRSGK